MDAAGAVDAQNASTAHWKTAQNAVSHSAHTHHRLVGRRRRRALTVTASHTKFRTVPELVKEKQIAGLAFTPQFLALVLIVSPSCLDLAFVPLTSPSYL
jgi:hypothetical protein